MISIREFAVGALNAEMGLQVADPDLAAAHAGARVVTPAGMVLDGSTDIIEAPPAGLPELDPALIDLSSSTSTISSRAPESGPARPTSDRSC